MLRNVRLPQTVCKGPRLQGVKQTPHVFLGFLSELFFSATVPKHAVNMPVTVFELKYLNDVL